jgi:hypothetical protein
LSSNPHCKPRSRLFHSGSLLKYVMTVMFKNLYQCHLIFDAALTLRDFAT